VSSCFVHVLRDDGMASCHGCRPPISPAAVPIYVSFTLLAGNATFADVVVIWARNMDTKQVNAFVVKKGTPGFTTTKIENKISLR
jgi:hypothetical protein